MSSVIDLRAYVNPSVIQTLVLVDLQQEYIASPRVLALEDTKGALANCRAALAHARAMGLPVAYVRWIDRTPLFNKATRFSRWIEGFEPHGVDMIFERNRPSCYASADFAEVMSSGGGSFVLAGFAGEAACLATAIADIIAGTPSPIWMTHPRAMRSMMSLPARASRSFEPGRALRRGAHDRRMDRQNLAPEQQERAGRWKRARPILDRRSPPQPVDHADAKYDMRQRRIPTR
jgi:hypothetical protein